ncbi:TrkH family potassium uptake protein [Mesobacillus subterraneus]|uniref:TrkH family potassium uptake protein n=1 Tax=Mesobacillus subterraneus TaxID=285983 RepID=A0A427TV77_9BACI|nr:TrkH family potassium uptake protein [Mesobacillus subterraneus]RSD28247.1 TrkH family potassium uptake protein [Mesobacillus subterraneus]
MWINIRKRLKKLSPAQIIVTYYLIAVVISMILLSLPVAIQPGADWTFMDALFTAASAVSVTGLSVITVRDTFTVPGVFILMLVLQIGGIGVMALGTFFWLIIRKKIGLQERRLIMLDQNQTSMSGLVKMLKDILVIIIIIELIGALLLGLYFMKYFPTWQEAFLHGMFASVSATTNGGFDITGASLIPYAQDYFVVTINIILITLGAIGFPVLVELKSYLFRRKKKAPFHFTLFLKITSITFLGLLIFGTVAIWALEYNHFLSDKSFIDSFFYAFFQSTTTRSGGLATMDVNDFTDPTLFLMAALMFIGASPSSVGGGIRTTTFALNLLFLYHFARGRRSIKIFNRELHQDDLIKSLVVSIMAVIICFFAVLILMITENQPLLAIIFEVASAFGTTGLSMGITPELSNIGKSVLIILMFIGRVGVISFLLIIGGRTYKESVHYPKERVIIG